MEWARIQAAWPYYKRLAHLRWVRISAIDLHLIGGRRALLATHIGQTYGISEAAAGMQLDSWQARQREPGSA